MNEADTTDVVVYAGRSLVEYGVVGSVAVLGIAAAVVFARLWIKAVTKHSDFLEDHYRDLEN